MEFVPQKQKNRHRPEEGLIGDCHRTCIAMLLGMDRDTVPNFAEMGFDINKPEGGNYKEFSEACEKWLRENGLAEFQVGFNDNLDRVLNFMKVINPGVRYILGGRSRSNCNHSVVAMNDEIIADPSLSNAGIVGPCEPDGYYWITVLIPLHQKDTRHG